MAQPRPPVALVLDPGHGGRTPTDWELAPADLRALLRSGKLLRHVLRHPSARLLVDDIEGLSPPKAILASRLFTTGPARIEDRAGRTIDLNGGALLRLLGTWTRDLARAPQVLREAAPRRRDAGGGLARAATNPALRPLGRRPLPAHRPLPQHDGRRIARPPRRRLERTAASSATWTF